MHLSSKLVHKTNLVNGNNFHTSYLLQVNRVPSVPAEKIFTSYYNKLIRLLDF